MKYSILGDVFTNNCHILSPEHKERDLPKRTSPFTNYVRVIFTPQQLPVRRLTSTDYQYITANLGNIWETL